MSDVATVSICITVLVALLIIHLMIKNGRGIKLSGKTKFGDFGIETSETLQSKLEAVKQLETKAKEIPVKVESSEINVDFEQFVRFARLLRHVTYQVSKIIIGYLMMNHVDLEDRAVFAEYVKNRVYDIVEVYNKALLKSDDLLIKGLTVDSLLGEYNKVFYNVMKTAYGDMFKIWKSLPLYAGRKLDQDVAETFEGAVMQIMDILTEELDCLQTMMLDAFYQRYIKKNELRG